MVSIIGDSVSTFKDFNPPGYAVYYDDEMQKYNGLSSVYDTWWAIVNQALHAFLCVNNSYSGSKVTGDGFPAASCIDRISHLHTEKYNPDIILIYIGFNDFGNGVCISKKKSIIGRKKLDLTVFEDAYGHMIDLIKERYPQAKIVCGTLMRTKIIDDETWRFPENYLGNVFENYNIAIRRIAKKKKIYLADLGALSISYETHEGSHPTVEGHRTIANAWINCLANLNLLEPTIETCIKFYQVNKENDMSVYMVFQALAKEKVLMAFDQYDNLLGIRYGDDIVIAVFTSPNEIGKEELINAKPIYLRDNLDVLSQFGKNIVVNPFSSQEKQFVIPYGAIDKMLKPLIKK